MALFEVVVVQTEDHVYRFRVDAESIDDAENKVNDMPGMPEGSEDKNCGGCRNYVFEAREVD